LHDGAAVTSAQVLSSTGLSTRTAAVLAYAGWWVTGLVVWFLERRDAGARFHAAQSMVAFGVIGLLVVVFAVLAAASLTFMPSAFRPLIGVAGGAWLLGVVLWAVSLWRAAAGLEWRIPLVSRVADRLIRG
jgi:uncharacterized membrane protein